MKVKETKPGNLYVLIHENKQINISEINHFRHHKGLGADEIRNVRYPTGINYLHITNNYAWNRSKDHNYPILYLGTTKEKWWCSRADWMPIKKRHWCMFKGKRMILDAWSVKHLKPIGVENEQ
jgi:hypothetical protein